MTAKASTFPWPQPPGHSEAPCWTGRGFRLGSSEVPVLSFQVGASGWTDDLTAFHEEESGGRHPIELASRSHALEQVRTNLPKRDAVVLEIGCSSGYMLRELKLGLPDALVIGADYIRGPLESLARSMPDTPILQFDLCSCPLPDASIDAVVLLNVLEHIKDDRKALQQVWRILKPGGIAVVEVPAGPRLYDVYDKLLMHFRRYELREIANLCEAVGFEITRSSHLGFFVYPLFALVKMRNRRLLSADEAMQRRVVATNIRTTRKSGLLGWMMKVELATGRLISYPAGIRCLVTCRKPV